MDIEDKIDALAERVEQLAARLKNIEFVLGMGNVIDPLHSDTMVRIESMIAQFKTD